MSLVWRTCVASTCGVQHKIPEHIDQQARKLGDKRTVYCPNGHPTVYVESEADVLRKQVEQLKRQVADLQELRSARSKDVSAALRLASYWKGIAHRRPR